MEPQLFEERTKLLLVDDSAENLLALEAVLESLGQELVSAHSGSEALRYLLDSDFAAILLDVKMPNMDGFETAELIRSRPRSRHIPILFLTAFRGDDQLHRGYTLGAVDFLFKPVIPEILRSKVKVFVELSRANAALRRQAEILRDTEQQFRMLLEAAPDPMIVSTDSGVITFANSRTETIFDYPRGYLVGQKITRLLPDWARIELLSQSGEAARCAGSFGVEIEGRRRGNRSFPAEISLCRINTKDGLAMISVVRDITERKEAEREIRDLNTTLELRVAERTAELRQANDALRRSNEDLNHFAYAASHDLREPLRIISIYSDVLRKHVSNRLEPEDARLLSEIGNGARRMDLLLRRLLEYAQVDSLNGLAENVDCAAVMQEVLSNLHASVDETRADIAWEDLPVLRIPRIYMLQLLQNLVENSIKYRRDVKPLVRIRSQQDEEGIVLSVSDNGIGIESQYLNLIFGVFKRLHSHSSYSGAGIGLAICQRIMEKCDGRIWVESVPGQGSCFYIRFPLSIAQQLPEAASQTAS